jgi:cytochrome P450/NADPH-cytochrome P450 reductase
VLFVTSTYNGEPPDNALRFAKWLPAAAAAAGGAGEAAAQGLPYAVLGVGNSQWATYQAFPRCDAQRFLCLVIFYSSYQLGP